MTDAATESKLRGCVVGSLVADAAGMPCHWVYPKLHKPTYETMISEHPDGALEFSTTTYNPFYVLPVGDFSGYGDQSYVLLKSLVEAKGWNKEVYKRLLYEHFGPGSKYEPSTMATDSYEHDGKTAQKIPVHVSVLSRVVEYVVTRFIVKRRKGGWRHASIKEFLKRYGESASVTGLAKDAQMDGVAKVAPMVALYAGKPELLTAVEEMVRVTQQDPIAVECAKTAAHIMERILLQGTGDDVPSIMPDLLREADEGLPDGEATTKLKRGLKEVVSSLDEPYATFAVRETVGLSCTVPNNLINSLHCFATATATATLSFERVTRATMKATGCTCSRLLFLGACVGAAKGEVAVPDGWLAKTTRGEEIRELARQLVDMRT
ncbi:unnamed protein product [Vitrella brassicaformis CCMP3155]|uniref:ADP-ribosylglycohydrolase n=2 Tax=Vitrella brassicaformis TaxID=1169539 RepID=A0A0G4FYI9_VITBC|nr:unnamed protein product [Vitrella brassicaformis CCMP3155]|eukprot:CEM20425.1 unnamed protein product [Vitrella brassicaformis CCMP3155]